MKRKLYIFLISLIIFFLSALTMKDTSFVDIAFAWDDCPKGLVNDEYPGSCSKYVDTDGNGICDRSEPAPEDRIQYQDINEVTTEKQTEDPIVLSDSKESGSLLNKGIISFISIFIPLMAIVGYASIYKIKQSKRS